MIKFWAVVETALSEDCADNCTISASDVTWVKKHLTQGFLCQVFLCVCTKTATMPLS